MTRALLLSCNVTREPYPVYPLGLTMVADGARRRSRAYGLAAFTHGPS